MPCRLLLVLLPALLATPLSAGCGSSPTDPVHAFFDSSNERIADVLDTERRRILKDLIDADVALGSDAVREDPARETELVEQKLAAQADLDALAGIRPEDLRLRYTVADVVELPDGRTADVITLVQGNTLRRSTSGALTVEPLPEEVSQWVFVCRLDPETGEWQLVIPPTLPDVLKEAREQEVRDAARDAARDRRAAPADNAPIAAPAPAGTNEPPLGS